MIQLSDAEVKIIKLCKGHLQELYPFTGKWTKTLKPLFIEIYGWYDRRTYHSALFNKLFEIHTKISYDQSGTNLQLRSVFYASFGSKLGRYERTPIERAISELCALIQGNLVIENGVERYKL